MKRLKRAEDWFLKQPVLIAVVVLIVATMWVILLSKKYYDASFGVNVLVEAHGMLFDIFVIGVFILWLNERGEKQRTIQRYHDEIDDFRGWDSPEAAYRIVGNIRRLNKLNVTNLNLAGCYLKEMDLNLVDLRGADLFSIKLQGAELERAKLQGAVLHLAELQDTRLHYAHLQGANLDAANLEGAYLINTELQDASFDWAILQDVNLNGTDLRGAKNLTAEQLASAKNPFRAKLDPNLEAELTELKKLNPELFYPHF